jgi:hypothetical protein
MCPIVAIGPRTAGGWLRSHNTGLTSPALASQLKSALKL